MRIRIDHPVSGALITALAPWALLRHGFNTADVVDVAKAAEAQLAGLNIPYKARQGAKLTAGSGEPVAKAYRVARRGTIISIERGSKYWYLTSIGDRTLWPADGGERNLYLTTEQDEIAVSAFRVQYDVQRIP